MTYFPNKDYLIEVKLGNVPGAQLVHISARAATSTAWRVVHDQVIAGAAVIPEHMTTAAAVRIKAGNANDDASGTGARTILVTGLDETGALASETITTAGASAGSYGSTTFIRTFRAVVATCGTYGTANVANCVVQSAGQDLLTITIIVGSSLSSMYTIPLGKTGYLLECSAQVGTAGSTRLVCYTRKDILDSSVPVAGRVIEMYQETVAGQLLWQPQGGLKMNALTDVWFETFGGTTTIYVTYTILLIDN